MPSNGCARVGKALLANNIGDEAIRSHLFDFVSCRTKVMGPSNRRRTLVFSKTETLGIQLAGMLSVFPTPSPPLQLRDYLIGLSLSVPRVK